MPATSYLLRLSEAAELLGLTPGPARRWLAESKVPCIDYGPGRGLGPRWVRDEVLEAIQRSLRVVGQKAPARRKLPSRPILGRSPAELAAEIVASRSNIQ